VSKESALKLNLGRDKQDRKSEI